MKTIDRSIIAPLYLLLAPCAVVVMLTGCGKQEPTPQNATVAATVKDNTITLQDAQVKQLQLTTATVERSTVSSPLHANGTIDVAPQHRAVVSSPIGGTITKIHVQAGQQVSAGAALLTLEHRDVVQLQQDYLTTMASLAASQSELARQERLAQDQVNARKVVEQLTAEVTGMRVRAASLREQLALLGINAASLRETSITRSIVLRAPVSGYVTDVRTSMGAYVQPQDVLVSVVNTATMYADLVVYERDAAAVAEGQDVDLRSASDTVALRGRIRLVGRSVGSDRAIRVMVPLPPTSTALRPGMAVTGTIHTTPRSAVVVPSASVVQWQGTSYVFTQNDDRTFKRHAIESGTTYNGATEVRGANATSFLGKRIVVRGAAGLLGAMVNTEE